MDLEEEKARIAKTRLKGRQNVWWLKQEFRTSELEGHVYGLKELDEYRMANNDLVRYEVGWDRLMMRVKPLPDERVLL